MKYYQTHHRFEVDKNVCHSIGYIKAKNKKEALKKFMYDRNYASSDEVYILEVSKKTIKDQAQHHLDCSKHWDTKLKTIVMSKIDIHCAEVSRDSTKNWAKSLMELIK
jgi:hypothetical protein